VHVTAEHHGHVARKVARPHDVVAGTERNPGGGPQVAPSTHWSGRGPARRPPPGGTGGGESAGKAGRTDRAYGIPANCDAPARAARSRRWTGQRTRAGARAPRGVDRGSPQRSWCRDEQRPAPRRRPRARGRERALTSQAGRGCRYSQVAAVDDDVGSPRRAGSRARRSTRRSRAPTDGRLAAAPAGRSRGAVVETNSTRHRRRAGDRVTPTAAPPPTPAGEAGVGSEPQLQPRGLRRSRRSSV